jgi:hypothetical protein
LRGFSGWITDARVALWQVIGKTYTQGTDRYGRPVIYIHVAKHRTFDQVRRRLKLMINHHSFPLSQSPKALEDFVLFQMESVRCLFAAPVDKILMVFDMTFVAPYCSSA